MRQYFAVNKEGDYFTFNKGDDHHILNVLRLKSNDEIYVNYESKTYLCTLEIDEQVKALISSETNIDNELPSKINLVYALVKGDKFDLVVQKTSELGVSKIIPFDAKRSVVKIDKNKQEAKVARWQKIAIEACKQSNRSSLVAVTSIATLKELVEYKSELNLIAYESASEVNTSILYSLLKKQYNDITLVVGPEGGFSESEVEFLKDNDFIEVSLGKRILRSETAPIYLLSVISFMLERGSNDEEI